MNYETSAEIEIAIAHHFGVLKCIIIPNLNGMFYYELDLCILSKALYAAEVEIKISKGDLKRDAKKHHCHDWNFDFIKSLWFAMPDKMKGCEEFVPEKAGILFVSTKGKVMEFRKPKINTAAKKWPVEKALALARLGMIRMWNLKHNEMTRYHNQK